MKGQRVVMGASAAAAMALTLGVASAQQAPPPAAPAASTQNYVSREEYDKLKQEQDELKQELKEMRQLLQQERAARVQATTPATPAAPGAETAPAAKAGTQTPATEYATHEDTDDLQSQIKSIKNELDRNRLGTSHFHIAGDGEAGFTAARHDKSTFDAGIAPLILWEPTDKILVEAAFDISGSTDSDGNSSTDFTLELANISYLVNDNLYVGAGLFVVPFGVYHRHFDPPWINKFPDDPLPFADGGIAPGSETGAFLGGVAPIGDMKLTYDLYVTNGPSLNTNSADSAGQLNFDDYTDLNNGKAVGGRIGFLPLPNVEMGYSAMFAWVNPDHFADTNAFLQAVDLNWRQDVDVLRGQIDFRTEWVWSNVERATYDPTGSDGFGPTSFSNSRWGGYVQLCYRPTKVDNKIIRNLELVSRYDILRSPESAPGGEREQRLTFGVDYWITPSVVLKTAYEFDDKRSDQNQNAFLVQLGFGL